MTRAHKLVLFAVLAEVLFIIWFFPYLPMVDLPGHIFGANVLAHHGDANSTYDQFFTAKLPWNPYSSYFWFAVALDPILGILNATRLYLSLALILMILAYGAWLREAAPQSQVQMLPATFLLFGLFFYIGLVNYLFSVPFMFFSFALHLRLTKTKDPSWMIDAGLALALLLTYFSHVVTFAITALVIGVQQLTVSRWRRSIRVLLSMAPSFLVMMIWLRTGLYDSVSDVSVAWDPLLERLQYFLLPFNLWIDTLERVWTYEPRTVIPWVLFVVIVLIAGRQTSRGGLAARAWVAALLVLSTLFFPSTLSNSSGALRLSYPAAFALLALVPTAWNEHQWLRRTVFALCIVHPLLLMPKLSAFQTEMAALKGAIEATPRGQVVQMVVTNMHSANFHTYPFLHADAWYAYSRGGTSPYLFSRIPHFPVHNTRVFVPNSPGEWNMAAFRYAEHQQGTDYFLVRTDRADILEDLQKHVPLLAQSADWMVFGPNSK